MSRKQELWSSVVHMESSLYLAVSLFEEFSIGRIYFGKRIIRLRRIMRLFCATFRRIKQTHDSSQTNNASSKINTAIHMSPTYHLQQ